MALDPDDWLTIDILLYEQNREDLQEILSDPEIESLTRLRNDLKNHLKIKTGEMIQQSPMTDKKYKVTVWQELGEDMFVAIRKQEIK